MCFRKKVKIADIVKKDRELIAENSKFICTTIVGCKEKTSFVEALKDLQEKLKYLQPSHKQEVIDYDKAINKKIMELNRIVVEFSANSSADNDLQEYILKINMLIADRNTIL